MQSLPLPDITYAINHYFWPLTRTLAIFSTAPIFSEKVAVKKVKIGLAVLIAFLIGQNLPDSQIALLTLTGLWITVKEIVTGAAIGVTVQFIFAAMRFAGEVIGLQMGLSFAAFFDPSGNQTMPVLARILNVIFTLLFLSFNGHLYLIKVLADSYTLLPISATPIGNGGFYLIPEAAGMIFRCGLKMGMPVIALLLTLNLTLGLLNRLTPQLSIFVIGFPISITLGMGSLLLVMNNFPSIFHQLMHDIFTTVNTVLTAFA
ncbi:flagellar biosynthetic protein FliR [Pantoea anthophila]|uniref:flagellar biosynthetic protein FliR n=1 Tax=Pantoea anthophila TaxID=470931 RepID=UPI0035209514